jgi:hypothetical protein
MRVNAYRSPRVQRGCLAAREAACLARVFPHSKGDSVANAVLSRQIKPINAIKLI